MHWAREALDRLDGPCIMHPNFLRAKTSMLTAITAAAPGEIICLVGPSRIGKSLLTSQIETMVTGDPTKPDSPFMPVVTMVADNNGTNGMFMSRPFTLAGLTAIRHPMFDVEDHQQPLGIRHIRTIERVSEGALREAFKEALKYRRVKYLVIDEAHLVSYIRGGIESAVAFMDSMKSLASHNKLVLILVGAYPLLPILLRSPHLLGRKMQVHFPRYRADVRNDVEAFQFVLSKYSDQLQLDRGSRLTQWNEVLFKGSIGCLGLLRTWIRDSLRDCLENRYHSLRLEHFRKNARSAAEMASIAQEIAEGEALLRGDEPSDAGAGSSAVARANNQTVKPFRAKARRYPVRKSGIRS